MRTAAATAAPSCGRRGQGQHACDQGTDSDAACDWLLELNHDLPPSFVTEEKRRRLSRGARVMNEIDLPAQFSVPEWEAAECASVVPAS